MFSFIFYFVFLIHIIAYVINKINLNQIGNLPKIGIILYIHIRQQQQQKYKNLLDFSIILRMLCLIDKIKNILFYKKLHLNSLCKQKVIMKKKLCTSIINLQKDEQQKILN